MLTGIETILIMSEPHLAAVSSSLVRELKALGKDITPFVPK
jgi:pantetheine-phosphate adenylyltransferase